MVKKTLLSPLVHLLMFLIVLVVLLFFFVSHGVVTGTVPGSFTPDYGAVFYRALWNAFLVSMPVSIFMVIFHIRRHRTARFLAGMLTLVSSTLLYGALVIGMERLLPYESMPEADGPAVPLVEKRFHQLPGGVIYPFRVMPDGGTGAALSAEPESSPVFSLHEGFVLEQGRPKLLAETGGERVFSLIPANPLVEPGLEPPAVIDELGGDFESFRRMVFEAAASGIPLLLLLLGAQGWFCVQSWVIVRAGRWPFVNLFLGAGLFLLFMKAHSFAAGPLWGRLIERLPAALPRQYTFAALLLFISLPLFFWNIFSRGEAAGHE